MDRYTFLSLSALGVLALPLKALAAPQQTKALSVVPRSGVLADTTVYTNSFAVLVGVSRYAHTGRNLSFAAKDATELRDVLVASYGFLPENVVTLTDSQATKKAIERALAQLASAERVKPTDRVLVYFAGHGRTITLPTAGEMGFLIPHDAEVNLEKTSDNASYLTDCIAMSRLWELLEACPARHRLFVADASCGPMLLPSPSPVGNLPLATLKNLLARPALQSITAGERPEDVVEDPKLGHGALTLKLLEELRALATTSGELLTASALGAALKTRVGNLTRTRQSPLYGSRGTEGEFLFVSLPATSASATIVTPPKNEPVPKKPVIATGEGLGRGSRRERKGGAEQVFIPRGKIIFGELQESVVVFDFWMDATPVTVGQYKAYCEATKKSMPPVPEFPVWAKGWDSVLDHPIVNVTWLEAKAYADWAGCRLPTSAEFEFAARDGGQKMEYPWGDDAPSTQLWFTPTSKGKGTAPVGRTSYITTNSLGLSDMAGNVWQWCADGSDSGSRYTKGGSWFYGYSHGLRCEHRNLDLMDTRTSVLGFRLCLTA